MSLICKKCRAACDVLCEKKLPRDIQKLVCDDDSLDIGDDDVDVKELIAWLERHKDHSTIYCESWAEGGI